MSKEKQIEEITELICNLYDNGKCTINGFICDHNCEYKRRAEHLYNADYRKQSEVAREILTEFANMLKCHSFYMTDAYGEVNENIVTVKAIVEVEEEFKKKYTEGEK